MLGWNEYINQGTVRKTISNKGKIKALIQISIDRIDTISEINLNEKNASVLFTNYYDVLREICEAIALLNGYKIYLHEAIGLFLREILNENHNFIKFDKFRVMRNGVNYYGKPVEFNEALQSIKDINQMVLELKSKYLKEFL